MRTLHILTIAALATTLSWQMTGTAGIEHAAPVKETSRTYLVEDVQDHEHLELVERIHSAMVEWAPASTIVGTHSQAAFEAIAQDIVKIATDPKEPALFKSRYKTAILLTTMAYFEGHFWPYVEDGTCNHDRSNPVLKNGGCDSGEAYSLWQIHPSNNIVLNWNVWLHAVDPKTNPNIITGQVLLEDRKAAARTALHMLRASLQRNSTLCEYTGENVHKLHPKADARLKFARDYWTKHPFEN